MDGGFTNLLLKCSPDADADDEQEKVIMRVFGDHFVHRDSEIFIMRKLGEHGVIAPMYCR